MKKQTVVFFFFFLSIVSASGQKLEPAPEGKAVVYFVRPSSLGFAINFSYFDSAQLVGKFNGPKYIRYECEPGTHLFWAKSENRDFLEAEVEAGRIYFIEAVVKMGAVKAAVNLRPVDPADTKAMTKILKLLDKKPSESFSSEELQAEANGMQDIIFKALEKYKEDKGKGKTGPRLEKSMYYKE